MMLVLVLILSHVWSFGQEFILEKEREVLIRVKFSQLGVICARDIYLGSLVMESRLYSCSSYKGIGQC